MFSFNTTKETKEWCTVSIRGAEGELYEITSTPGHKYFVPGNRVRKDSRAPEHASYAGLSEKWVSACDLKHGDKVLLSDGTLCEVEGVTLKQLETPETTYNLEVADFHTYYVSDACVLVHNLDCGKPKSPRKVDDGYIKSNSIDAHAFKNKAGKIPKNQISRYDIYKDTASKNRLWIGDKSQSTWKPTDYYFDDLKRIWRK